MGCWVLWGCLVFCLVCFCGCEEDADEFGFFFGDPLYGAQWHLQNLGQRGGKEFIDLQVVGAWEAGYFGKGVSVAVVDSNMQLVHPDLLSNINLSYYYDINSQRPGAESSDTRSRKATAIAGLIGATANNNVCGVGVAPQVTLGNIRLRDGPPDDIPTAVALSYKKNEIDIYSCNWGSHDDGMSLEELGPYTTAALERNVHEGRNGRGSIYVWSAGNGRVYNDNCNYNGYTNSPYTITVGAVTSYGSVSSFSEGCAAMLVSAPGGDTFLDSPRIATTDLTGISGFDSGECTVSFGGTEAAAPQVAGVVALMLEANPHLTWREVQHVLVKSGRRTLGLEEDTFVGGWVRNGAGLLHHEHFGFGLVNATQAVFAAKQMETRLPARLYLDTDDLIYTDGLPIPDNDTSLDLVYEVKGAKKGKKDFSIEHVQVIFWSYHEAWGDIAINLTSPSGTVSRLALLHALGSREKNPQYKGWAFMSVRCWGESPRGKWTLSVRDELENGKNGAVLRWRLNISGYYADDHPPPLPTHVSEQEPLRAGDESISARFGSILWRFLVILTPICIVISILFVFFAQRSFMSYFGSFGGIRGRRDADGIFDSGDGL